MHDRGMIKWMPFNSVVSSKEIINSILKDKSKISMPILSEEQKYVNEQKLSSSKQKLVNFLKHHSGRCPRSKITKDAHIDAKTLDDLLKNYPRSFKEQTRPQANGHPY